MGFYTDQLLPRITDVALRGAPIEQLRRRATEGLDGVVLEVGFGSGRNVPHYPRRVERVLAVDPATVGRRLAAGRVAASTVPVDYVGLDGAQLALDDASVDHVLSTWTLCTIPHVAQALSEVRRVLRPGGTLHFVEHGRAPGLAVLRWQQRLNPLQRRLFGGCHLDRPIDLLIEGASLEIEVMERFYMRGPKPFGSMYVGRARRPEPGGGHGTGGSR
jgi:SAM-dependent methyltransferase